MKTPRLLALALGCLFFASAASAQTPPAQAPAPVAGDAEVAAFLKLRDDKAAKPGPARFQQVIGAGLKVLIEFPKHPRATATMAGLASFGGTMSGKQNAANRDLFRSALNFEIVNQRDKAETDEARGLLAALDAALAGAETRDNPSRDTLATWREKVDTLAQTPGGMRHLAGQERDYGDTLRLVNPNAGEAHFKKLLAHEDKAVVRAATEELGLIEARRTPMELKFTAADGKACDLAALRGKIVLLVFVTATEAAAKELDAIRTVYGTYKRNGFEVVVVALDKEADREKVTKFLKTERLPWPAHYDGQEGKNPAWAQLLVRSAPNGVLLDQKGQFVANGVRAWRLEADLKRMLGIK